MKGSGAATHRQGAHFDDIGYTTHNSKCSPPSSGSEKHSFRKPSGDQHMNPRLDSLKNVSHGGQPSGKTRSF